MTKPYDLLEQETHNWFRPKHRKAVLFAQSKFDAVHCFDKKKMEMRQFYPDLEYVKNDCELMKQGLKNFEILEKDIIDLSDNPDMKKTSNALDGLSKELRESKKMKPPEKFLVVFLFAGHGILRDGM